MTYFPFKEVLHFSPGEGGSSLLVVLIATEIPRVGQS